MKLRKAETLEQLLRELFKDANLIGPIVAIAFSFLFIGTCWESCGHWFFTSVGVQQHTCAGGGGRCGAVVINSTGSPNDSCFVQASAMTSSATRARAPAWAGVSEWVAIDGSWRSTTLRPWHTYCPRIAEASAAQAQLLYTKAWQLPTKTPPQRIKIPTGIEKVCLVLKPIGKILFH